MKEEILESTAKFFYNVFKEKYDEIFEKMLTSGGGGNSMFVNAWVKPSAYFIRKRISGEALKRIAEKGHTLETIPHVFIRHNAKGQVNRRLAGKELHEDHNPGNVKVLSMIKDKVRSYAYSSMTYDQKIKDLMEYMSGIQTLDIITIEQDDIRTYKDTSMNKSHKNTLGAKERDLLLNDTWTLL